VALCEILYAGAREEVGGTRPPSGGGGRACRLPSNRSSARFSEQAPRCRLMLTLPPYAHCVPAFAAASGGPSSWAGTWEKGTRRFSRRGTCIGSCHTVLRRMSAVATERLRVGIDPSSVFEL
jgi:hypothetical protein